MSFSQFGEDIIMQQMLERYKVNEVTYLDIGANDPINGSNTYGFYLRGYKGVLIEPNVVLYNKIRKVRPKDVCLNFGISSDSQAEADYFMFSEEQSGMNTFSEQDALDYQKDGFKIQKVVKVALKNVNDVIAENFKSAPTVISLDVEGLDEIILNKLDFDKFHPLLICVESVSFNLHGEFIKKQGIFDLLTTKGYFVYADTNVNTIFCSRKLLDKLLENIHS